MNTIHIVAEIEVKPEFKEELMPVFKKLVDGSRAEAGNKGYDMTVSLDNPCHFFVLENWASEQAIEEHGASAHFQAFVKAVDGKAVKLVITKTQKVF